MEQVHFYFKRARQDRTHIANRVGGRQLLEQLLKAKTRIIELFFRSPSATAAAQSTDIFGPSDATRTHVSRAPRCRCTIEFKNIPLPPRPFFRFRNAHANNRTVANAGKIPSRLPRSPPTLRRFVAVQGPRRDRRRIDRRLRTRSYKRMPTAVCIQRFRDHVRFLARRAGGGVDSRVTLGSRRADRQANVNMR